MFSIKNCYGNYLEMLVLNNTQLRFPRTIPAEA
jgi:hypothetical protein